MNWLLVILDILIKALPLFAAAFGIGVVSAGDGNKLAASVASLSDMQLNLLIWGGLGLHLLGHASGWTASGFFALLKTAAAWIAKTWGEAKPAA